MAVWDRMTTLPPELAAFSYLLDAQPAPVRDAFHYCLCLLMVEASKMRLVENGEICVFETVARVKFSVTKPALSRDQEAALIDVLRVVLEEERMRAPDRSDTTFFQRLENARPSTKSIENGMQMRHTKRN